MENQAQVRATLRLGSETFSFNSKEGILSEQLASLKEESMTILKDFITRHNVPNDVPDEPLEGSSGEEEEEEEGEVVAKPPKSKKQK